MSTLAQVKKDLETDKLERTMAHELRIFEYLDEVMSSEVADKVLIGHAKDLEEEANALYTEISEEIEGS